MKADGTMSTELKLEIDGKPRKLAVEGRKGNKVAFQLDGRKYEAEILRTEGARVSLRMNGRAWEVEAVERAGDKGGWETRVGGKNLIVKAGSLGAAPRLQAPPTAPKAPERKPPGPSADSVEAPMPGKILKLFVAKGQKVKAGDLLLTLEAMKMENRIQAPRDAVVADIRVQPGANVAKNEVLIVLKN